MRGSRSGSWWPYAFAVLALLVSGRLAPQLAPAPAARGAVLHNYDVRVLGREELSRLAQAALVRHRGALPHLVVSFDPLVGTAEVVAGRGRALSAARLARRGGDRARLSPPPR